MAVIVLRAAAEADVPAIARIFRDASLSNAGDREALLAHPEVLEWPVRLLGDGRTTVAVVADAVVGFARVDAGRADGSSELEDIFVDPAWTRQGVARTLIDRVAEDERTRGTQRIEVTANDHARAFYLACGFVDGERVRTELGEGRRMHRLLTR